MADHRPDGEISLQQLRLAQVELPDFHPEAPGSDTVYGFLVRDGDACVLVDTGIGTGSPLIDRLYRPERVELSDALAGAGVSIEQVTAVVNSHLHFDHCGNNSLFPGVPIYVQEDELAAARQPRYTVPEWVDFPASHYVPIQGRHSITAHMELVPTPGHTPGHQSLMLRSGAQVELIVAQAAYTAAEFQVFQACSSTSRDEPDLQAFLQSNATWSPQAYKASLLSLHRLRPARAFFSHDSSVWKRAA